jgi:hypothetical protein
VSLDKDLAKLKGIKNLKFSDALRCSQNSNEAFRRAKNHGISSYFQDALKGRSDGEYPAVQKQDG